MKASALAVGFSGGGYNGGGVKARTALGEAVGKKTLQWE